jgi:predicted Zn-ribbon and HTH transcriptional regulator
VPALRFFVCNGCGTVYADVEKPPACHRCADERIERLRAEDQAFDYFTGNEQ